MPLQDDIIVVADGDRVSSEHNIASGIAKLTHRQEGLGGKGWDNVAVACSSRKPG